ncbi:MAG: hypothetical protein FJX74_06985, partial [Armatimonadetes bacterium]|nr:hypothetical protein [Armatimonadota bacterium]
MTRANPLVSALIGIGVLGLLLAAYALFGRTDVEVQLQTVCNRCSKTIGNPQPTTKRVPFWEADQYPKTVDVEGGVCWVCNVGDGIDAAARGAGELVGEAEKRLR